MITALGREQVAVEEVAERVSVCHLEEGPQGGLLIGSPEEIAERIILMHQHWGHVRQYIHIDMGAVPQPQVLRAIELFGTEVRPLVQRELGSTSVDTLMKRAA